MRDTVRFCAIAVLCCVTARSQVIVAPQAGKIAWTKIKAIFGWPDEPSSTQISTEVKTRLEGNQALSQEILRLLQGSKTGTVSALVVSIDAEKVVVVQNMKVDGDFNM